MKIGDRSEFQHAIRWYREINGTLYMFETYHHGTGHVETLARKKRPDNTGWEQVHRLYFR